MLDAAQAARRRDLQHRAYAPDGGLSDAELAELHDLDNRNLAVPQAAASPAVAAVDADADAEVTGDAAPSTEVTEPVEAPSRSEDTAPPASAPRAKRRIPVIPLLAVAALAVGVLVGAFVFGRLAGPVMSAEQQDTWTKLAASGMYDPGSIHLAGSKYGASVWSATQHDGSRQCMILTRPKMSEVPGTGCENPEDAAGGTPRSAQATINYRENGTDYQLWATITDDITGNPIVTIQRQNTDEPWDWRSQYSAAELKMVDALAAVGFNGDTLSILGYDGETPVWVSLGDQQCLMVVQQGDVHKSCAGSGAAPPTLTVGTATYGILTSDRGSAVLTITRASGAAR